MKIALSSGHGKHIRGARGDPVPPQLDEVDQARRVVDRVAELLKKTSVGIVTLHDDTSTSQQQNLNAIVAWHNKQTRDYDVSCHFNAYNHQAHGTEVLYLTQQTLAKKVCDAIVAAGHFTNRGAKYNGGLAFLNGTSKPAILLEVCFCDNTSDSNLYNQHFEAICEAIAESIGGVEVPDEIPPQPEHPPPLDPNRPGRPDRPGEAEENRFVMTLQGYGDMTVTINGQKFVVGDQPGPADHHIAQGRGRAAGDPDQRPGIPRAICRAGGRLARHGDRQARRSWALHGCSCLGPVAWSSSPGYDGRLLLMMLVCEQQSRRPG